MMMEEDAKIFEKNHLAKTETRRVKLTKENLEKSILANSGLTFDVCYDLGCSPKQFWNAVGRYGLKEFVTECRQQLVNKAESTLNSLLDSEDDKTKASAAKFILERLDREHYGQGPQIQQQINVVDKEIEIKNIFGV